MNLFSDDVGYIHDDPIDMSRHSLRSDRDVSSRFNDSATSDLRSFVTSPDHSRKSPSPKAAPKRLYPDLNSGTLLPLCIMCVIYIKKNDGQCCVRLFTCMFIYRCV